MAFMCHDEDEAFSGEQLVSCVKGLLMTSMKEKWMNWLSELHAREATYGFISNNPFECERICRPTSHFLDTGSSRSSWYGLKAGKGERDLMARM